MHPGLPILGRVPNCDFSDLLLQIHAGDGKTGRAMAELGYQIITLTSEAQALRRGALQHLQEAAGRDGGVVGPTVSGYQ